MLRLFIAVFALAVSSCSPPCNPGVFHPENICHRADEGAIAPDTAFVLQGTTYTTGGTCQVTVDGGFIDLQIVGPYSCGLNNGAAEKRAPDTIRCTIPPLPAGTYTANSEPRVNLTIPDAGLGACP